MIEFVPVMLFILGWHPDRPGEIDLQRPGVLFASMEDCERDGAKMAARMTLTAADKSGANYKHQCLAFPARDEIDAVLREKFDQKD
ncbi:MAG: hypothetical protein AAF941_03570 [Pseudomonadota bacterium]